MPVVEAGRAPARCAWSTPSWSPRPRGAASSRCSSSRYLLRLIVVAQLAQMYAASLLGLAWSYVQPAMRFAIYYLVMGFILKLHEGFPYFALHLFTGIVVVHYFGETWSGGTRSIWQNRALVKKMRMPREIFPVASMLVAGVPHAAADARARGRAACSPAGTSPGRPSRAGLLGRAHPGHVLGRRWRCSSPR